MCRIVLAEEGVAAGAGIFCFPRARNVLPLTKFPAHFLDSMADVCDQADFGKGVSRMGPGNVLLYRDRALGIVLL